ncbi:hypothetical protein F383_38776 [Gossypium arboreum]|uniref:Uncharacterized protein n=1 Tax=Gossypium arboreum TaxID=29729 RepID=A0A0B0MM63_GOSAR|nr:hypothetical protein F383_38776 [Gossypium arboreum]
MRKWLVKVEYGIRPCDFVIIILDWNGSVGQMISHWNG